MIKKNKLLSNEFTKMQGQGISIFWKLNLGCAVILAEIADVPQFKNTGNYSEKVWVKKNE